LSIFLRSRRRCVARSAPSPPKVGPLPRPPDVEKREESDKSKRRLLKSAKQIGCASDPARQGEHVSSNEGVRGTRRRASDVYEFSNTAPSKGGNTAARRRVIQRWLLRFQNFQSNRFHTSNDTTHVQGRHSMTSSNKTTQPLFLRSQKPLAPDIFANQKTSGVSGESNPLFIRPPNKRLHRCFQPNLYPCFEATQDGRCFAASSQSTFTTASLTSLGPSRNLRLTDVVLPYPGGGTGGGLGRSRVSLARREVHDCDWEPPLRLQALLLSLFCMNPHIPGWSRRA